MSKNTKWLIFILALAVSTTQANTPTQEISCAKIKYIPKSPITIAGSTEISSVSKFSPTALNNNWYVFDHIGYKDSAFQGERHVAKVDDGIQFFGYDKEPLTDVMLLKHPDGENQVINTVQTPVRADWHTLNGNGILFGCTFNNLPTTLDNNIYRVSSDVKISGYSVVATLDSIEVRSYKGVSIENLGKDYSVLYTEPKKCPGQNITVEITNGIVKVFLGSKEIYNFEITTTGRGTGLVATYEEHNCSSLSSVIMFNHTVNNVDYLKKTWEGSVVKDE